MSIEITYFVHGTTTDNENHISTGWSHGILSKSGRKQASDLGKILKKERLDVIFSSDLKRAADSAKLMFPRRKIIIDKRLRECNYGKMNGASSDMVESMQPKALERPFPDGESYKDAEARVRSFLKDVRSKYDGKKIAIVSHKAPQLALDVIIKGKTWKQAFQEDWRHKKAWQPGWKYILE